LSLSKGREKEGKEGGVEKKWRERTYGLIAGKLREGMNGIRERIWQIMGLRCCVMTK